MDRMTSTICIERIKRALGKIYFKDNIKFDKVIDYIVYNFNFADTDPAYGIYSQHSGLLEIYKLYLELGCDRDIRLNEYSIYNDIPNLSPNLSDDTLYNIVLFRARDYFHNYAIRKPLNRTFMKNESPGKNSIFSLFKKKRRKNPIKSDFQSDHTDIHLNECHNLTVNEQNLLSLLNKFYLSLDSNNIWHIKKYNPTYQIGTFDIVVGVSEPSLLDLWETVEIHLSSFPDTVKTVSGWNSYMDTLLWHLNHREDRFRERETSDFGFPHYRKDGEESASPDMLGCYESPLCDSGKRPTVHLYMDRITEFANRTNIDRLHIVLWVYIHEMVHAALDRYPYLFVKPYVKEIEEPIVEYITLGIIYNFEKFASNSGYEYRYNIKDIFTNILKIIYASRYVPSVSYNSLSVEMLSYRWAHSMIALYSRNIYEINANDYDVQRYIEDLKLSYPAQPYDLLERLNTLINKIQQP